MDAFLQFIALPSAVLALVSLISFSYHRTKQLNISPAIKQCVINIHALATEGCQLALVIIAILDTASCIATYMDMVGGGVVSSTKGAMLIEVFVLSSLIFHAVAIYSVDLIEAWILLGDTTPAYQWQPFVLTRSWVSSTVQRSRNGRLRRHNASRKTETSRTSKDHSTFRALTRPRPRKLDYLDLAIPEPVRRAAETDHQPPTLSSNTFSRSDRPTHEPDKHLTGNLLTPPDSKESQDTKRVKWAPTISVLSPTGTERRMSLP